MSREFGVNGGYISVSGNRQYSDQDAFNSESEVVATTINAPIATLLLTGLTPTVLIDTVVQAPIATLILTGLIPTVGISITINAPIATLLLTGLTPTVSTSLGGVIPDDEFAAWILRNG